MSSWGSEKTIRTDVLIIGGGMSGCFAAINAKQQGADVTLVDKAYVGKSGGTHFGEGDFTVFDAKKGHLKEDWIRQIVLAGEYLTNLDWADIVLSESLDRYKDLVSWGVKFVIEDNGKPFVKSRGVHEHVAMVHREYAPVLREIVLQKGINIIDRMVICDLLKQDEQILGAVGFSTTAGDIYVIHSGSTIIAAGNSSLKADAKPTHFLTADGEAMAYRAGAEIAGKEIPNCVAMRKIYHENTERLHDPDNFNEGKDIDTLARYPGYRGGVMGWAAFPTHNAEGDPIIIPAWEVHCGRAPLYVDLDAMPQWQKDLSINSFYTRMGTKEIDKIGLDLWHGGKLRFSPGRVEAGTGISAGKGIWPVDKMCATGVQGLYACGDSCATMLSGTGYAGMGLGYAHSTVTGARAGKAAAMHALNMKVTTADESEIARLKKIVTAPAERKGGFSPDWIKRVLHGLVVPYYVMEIKHEERLKPALVFVEFIKNHLVPKLMAKDPHELRMAHEVRNMVLNTEMILRASLFRTESRGRHFREDFPRRDDPAWLAWVKLRNINGNMSAVKEPIPEKWWPDLSLPYEKRYPYVFPHE